MDPPLLNSVMQQQTNNNFKYLNIPEYHTERKTLPQSEKEDQMCVSSKYKINQLFNFLEMFCVAFTFFFVYLPFFVKNIFY